MTMLVNLLFASTFVVTGFALPASTVLRLHEKREALGDHVVRRDRVHKDVIIPIRIGLTQSNLDQGYDHIMDVSHPKSANYGKYWTAEQIDAFFAPADVTVAAVTQWLVESHISEGQLDYLDKGWLAFDVPAHVAESLFNTEYFEYQFDNGDIRIGCDEYYLPEHLTSHVDYVRPGVTLSPPVGLRKRALRPSDRAPGWDTRSSQWGPPNWGYPDRRPWPDQPDSPPPGQSGDVQYCGQRITPPCLRALYGIPKATWPVNVSTLGIYEAGTSYAQGDLNKYFQKYAKEIPQGTHPKIDDFDGGSAPSPLVDASGEADIDFEMAYGILGAQEITLYQDGGKSNPTNLFVPFFEAIDGSFCNAAEKANGAQCGVFAPTPIVSFSYALGELLIPFNSQRRVCHEIMKLSLKGHTIIMATGDYGVASNQANYNSQGNGCADPVTKSAIDGSVFQVNFQANCPFVLSVGGTQLLTDGTVNDSEVAMYQPDVGRSDPANHIVFSSGGGFSNIFARPSYQNTAVDQYLSAHKPPYKSYSVQGGQDIGANGGLYNRDGRALPDVSANGANFASFFNSSTTLFYGTSLAAPIWASILTLISQSRSAAGKGPLGFVNPVLYEHPEAFHDITSGDNPGCGTNGFRAVPGWDPVTGLGTPIFPILEHIFLSLQ